jgi:hypothetical protein
MPVLNLSVPLSAHFTLKEMVRSATAERDDALKQEQENPSEDVVASLQYLATTVLEPIRQSVGMPLHISSGYRCPLVNKLVGGSATSQHCRGEAADVELSPSLITDPAAAAFRERVRAGVERRTGRPIRLDVDQNFYLFAHVCLNLDALDIDQVIHEYGDGFGRPAWVHVAASRRLNNRQVLFIGSYTDRVYLSMSIDDALARCCV